MELIVLVIIVVVVVVVVPLLEEIEVAAGNLSQPYMHKKS